MNKMFNSIRTLLLAIILLSATTTVKASHMMGGDLYYTWISGNTYRVTLTIYGDCSGGAFPTLKTSIATLDVYKSGTLFASSINMTPDTPLVGVEVTPLCPGYEDSSNCKGGTLPGITRFRWTTNVTLSGTDPEWVFLFSGNLTSSSAGRSGSITNLSLGGTMALADTLNNTGGPNSSAVFTTIPTPFFCINDTDNYNPGAIDPDGDSLSFSLVPGLDGSTGIVTYSTGYSATAPLAVAAGTYSFSTATGQVTFYPNALQKSLVVEVVRKYHNGVLVGTSMREMTFVVLPCTSKPPTVGVSDPNTGEQLSNVHVRLCQADTTLVFHMDPVNLDSNDITLTTTNLPKNATFTVVDNNTKHPKGTYNWKLNGSLPGTYTFYLTMQDNACPISSKSTVAVTVELLAAPKPVVVKVADASCLRLGEYYIAPGLPTGTLWSATIRKAGALVDSFASKEDTVRNNTILPDDNNKYTVRLSCYNSCVSDTSFQIFGPSVVRVDNIQVQNVSCYKYKDGRITFDVTGGYPPLMFKIDSTEKLSATPRFDSIYAAKHHIVVIDTSDCRYDFDVEVTQPLKLRYTTDSKPNECMGMDTNGIATINVAGGTTPYSYYWSSNIWNTNDVQMGNSLTGRPNGNYFVRVVDAHGCKDSATIAIKYDNCCIPYVPTAFTPNGDGRNDYFRPVWKGDVKVVNFSVYDRFGRRIYWSNTQDKGWDGTLFGVPQDMGTYYYYIKILCGNMNHEEIEFKGDLTLIR